MTWVDKGVDRGAQHRRLLHDSLESFRDECVHDVFLLLRGDVRWCVDAKEHLWRNVAWMRSRTRHDSVVGVRIGHSDEAWLFKCSAIRQIAVRRM